MSVYHYVLVTRKRKKKGMQQTFIVKFSIVIYKNHFFKMLSMNICIYMWLLKNLWIIRLMDIHVDMEMHIYHTIHVHEYPFTFAYTTHEEKNPSYYPTILMTKLFTNNITHKYTVYMSKFITNKLLHVYSPPFSLYISLFLWLLFPSLFM